MSTAQTLGLILVSVNIAVLIAILVVSPMARIATIAIVLNELKS